MRLALLLWLLLPLLASAQSERAPSLRLLVEVRDAETGEPLAGAHVGVDSLLRVSNSQGRAQFEGLASGEIAIGAAFLGYAPMDTTLTLARSSRVTFLMKPTSLAIGEVEVEADRFNAARLARVGFYSRQESRAGTFLTPEDIEKRGASLFSDLLRSVPGLRIETSFGRTTLTSTRRRDCSPSIYFDGTHARGLAEQLETVPLDGVLAVEIYRGPSEVPAEFAATVTGAECGAILVWTRAR